MAFVSSTLVQSNIIISELCKQGVRRSGGWAVRGLRRRLIGVFCYCAQRLAYAHLRVAETPCIEYQKTSKLPCKTPTLPIIFCYIFIGAG